MSLAGTRGTDVSDAALQALDHQRTVYTQGFFSVQFYTKTAVVN